MIIVPPEQALFFSQCARFAEKLEPNRNTSFQFEFLASHASSLPESEVTCSLSRQSRLGLHLRRVRFADKCEPNLDFAGLV